MATPLINPLRISGGTFYTFSSAVADIQKTFTDDDARFVFDNTLSPWLNEANKLGLINNFDHSPISIKFNIEQDKIDSFKRVLPPEFKII